MSVNTCSSVGIIGAGIQGVCIGLNLLKRNNSFALINGPISKTTFLKGKFKGITEYLAFKTKTKNFNKNTIESFWHGVNIYCINQIISRHNRNCRCNGV